MTGKRKIINKNIIILGANGFIGKEVSKLMINSFNVRTIYLLDLKNSNWSSYELNHTHKKKFLKMDVKKTENFKKILTNIDIIVDCIGSTNHNFDNIKKINYDFRTNFFCKVNFLNEISKLSRPMLYISIGSLFKFGHQKKIGVKIKTNEVSSLDHQILNKSLFEDFLKSVILKRDYFKCLILNIGNVYGYSKSVNYGMINELIVSFIRHKKFQYFFIPNKLRYKNVHYIEDLAISICNEILKSCKIKKKSIFIEKNYFGKIINLEKLIEYLKLLYPRTKLIKTPKPYLNNFYYYRNKLKVNAISKTKINNTIKAYKNNY